MLWAKHIFNDKGYVAGSGATFSKPSEWIEYPDGNFAVATSSCFSDLYQGYYWGNYAPVSDNHADTYIWKFNFNEMRGLVNDCIEEGNSLSGTTNLLDPELVGIPSGWHYPNLVLLGGYYTHETARMLLIRQYWTSY